MDSSNNATFQTTDGVPPSAKRKRSLSADRPSHLTPPAKTVKTHGNHLQINYLARHFSDNLPLISAEDALPSILTLIGDYDGVLQRHESMAGNLGARLLGPILIKRFERLFDGPPRVLKTHGKEGTSVTWLDVVEFARHKPEQFNLEKMRDGVRVCQFYTKQTRVEISEEDYLLIASSMPQKLIPAQLIAEDEEKELGTLEILERNIGHVVQLADQVSARARQLNHKLKNRKNAIISRREAEVSSANEGGRSSFATSTPHNVTENASLSFPNNGEQRTSQSPTSGFVAVNSRPSVSVDNGNNNNGYASSTSDRAKGPVSALGNGKSVHTASPATRAELLNYFTSPSVQSSANDYDQPSKLPASSSRPYSASKSKSKSSAEVIDYASILLNSASPVPIPNTPSSLLPYNRPSPADRYDDSGPYKAEMLARMDQLLRGDRVIPPCDRCRRLHMDCNKNLTACLGCTKKHAKCSWKDVTDKELRENPYVPRSEKEDIPEADLAADVSSTSAMVTDDPTQGVRDEELLGEDISDDSIPISPSRNIPDQPVPNTITDESVLNLGTNNEPSQNIDIEATPTRDSHPSDNHPQSSENVPEPQPTSSANVVDSTTPAPPTLSHIHEAKNTTSYSKPPDTSSSEYHLEAEAQNRTASLPSQEQEQDQDRSLDHHAGIKEQADRTVWNMLSKYERRREDGGIEEEEEQRHWGTLPSKIGANGGG